MSAPDYPSILHLSDPARTATLLSSAAAVTGRDWRVLPLAVAPPGTGVTAAAAKAARGLRWEAELALARVRTRRVHVHSVLARRHAGWAFGRSFALHLHGTDIRTAQYEDRHRELVHRTVREAQAVFYSTPDLKEHVAPLREDARLVPVPVSLPGPTADGAVTAPPPALRELVGEREYLFFASRWQDVKGGERQIEIARSLTRALSGPSDPVVVGLDWGPLAPQAAAAGVQLVGRLPHAEFLAALGAARLCIGQLSGVLGASELDALAADVPLVAPLDPRWYDGGHPSLVVPPVVGGVDLGMSAGADDLVDLVREELGSPTHRRTRSWVQEHHSARAALSEVLAGYRDSGW